MRKAYRFLSMLALTVAIALSGVNSQAQDKPTQEEAKQLAIKAAALLKEKGVEEARKAFHAEGEFKKGELYVFVLDMKGNWVIFPPKPQGEGTNMLESKDPDGKFIVKDILELAKTKGEGWTEYRWKNPATNQIQPKVTYSKYVPEHDLVACVGVYK